MFKASPDMASTKSLLTAVFIALNALLPVVPVVPVAEEEGDGVLSGALYHQSYAEEMYPCLILPPLFRFPEEDLVLLLPSPFINWTHIMYWGMTTRRAWIIPLTPISYLSMYSMCCCNALICLVCVLDNKDN